VTAEPRGSGFKKRPKCFTMEKCNIKKLSNKDIKQGLHINILYMFVSVENVEKNA
jgi:predicted rRNA methylase YqxC with S4 and FtsJ domains